MRPQLGKLSTPHRRGIPSLDGLRALAVTMVVFLHTLQRFSLHHQVPWFAYVPANGSLGVFIFFIISGYLITTLLLREHDKRGSIKLGSFYLRRAFRILPPLYVYVLVLVIVALLGHLPSLKRVDIVTALILFRNYTAASCWALEHFWSLCIEEQFYLLWPGVLVLSLLARKGIRGRNLAASIALGVIVVEPFVRMFMYRFHHDHALIATFHMQADPLMFGVLGALLQGTPRFEALYARLTRWPAWMAVLLFLGFGGLDVRFQNYWRLTVGMTIEGVVVLMWLLWLTRNPQSRQGRFFNQPVVAWVGRLSYSIYLWQTFFLHPLSVEMTGGPRWFNTFPGNWVAILLVATASFYGVEQPFLRLRDRVLRLLHDPEPAAHVLAP